MKKIQKREILTYILFGILTTIVGWGSYALFVNIFKMNVFWANALSWLLAIVFAFVVNKKWVFHSEERSFKGIVKELVTFFSTRLATGVLEITLVPLLEKLKFDQPFYSILSAIGFRQNILFTSGLYSKIFVSVVVVILNYIFLKLFVFRKSSKSD